MSIRDRPCPRNMDPHKIEAEIANHTKRWWGRSPRRRKRLDRLQDVLDILRRYEQRLQRQIEDGRKARLWRA